MHTHPPTFAQTVACACSLALIMTATIARAEAGADDLEALRSAVAELRAEYATRMAELEARIADAERAASRPAPVVETLSQTPPAAARAAGMYGPDFNPAIGVIFQGQAWGSERDPEKHRIAGFPLGGEAGPVPRGLALGETELDLNANVDDKFTAWLTLPLVVEDGEAAVEIEEAWIETLALPAGLSARFGRFFSGIGYLNDRHSHSWDFIDQPLPYQAFLGDQYLDDGTQLRWLAPTDLYLEISGEILRGGRYPAGGAENSGFGAQTVSVRAGGDVGVSGSWLAGVSYLHADNDERPSGDEDDPLLFSGDSQLAIVELVWKWAPQGNWRRRNFIFQSEYFWRNEDGDYSVPGAGVLRYDDDQSGWYVQAVYQPIPRWRFGARFDALWSDEPGAAFDGTDLEPTGGDPRRLSAMVDWSNSEFSRLRVQYTHDAANAENDSQWGLQYIHSIGAHGAHSF